MTTDFAKARENMVDTQIHTAGIVMPEILDTFQAIPREKFVPKNIQGMAYADEDIPIGGGRYLLEPGVHARMIQAADPGPDDVVLDIGGGTGYNAAILSPLVTTVIALEEKAEYLERAAQLWEELEVTNAVGVQGRLSEGDPQNAPFSLIFMGGAVSEIPANIAAQLTPDGRLIAIVRPDGAPVGRVTIVRNLGEGRYSSYNLFDAATPYLPGFEPKPAFRF